MKKILNLGHRGAAEVLENTIPSFEKALDHGADGVELDVRKTADDQLVVVHPPVVAGHAVQSSNYDEIRKLPGGLEVPLLKDVLLSAKAPATIRLGVEQRRAIRARSRPPRFR